jgi:hypothetical protein
MKTLSSAQNIVRSISTAIPEAKIFPKPASACLAPPWRTPVVELGVPISGAITKLFELPYAVDDAAKFAVTLVRPVTVAPAGV